MTQKLKSLNNAKFYFEEFNQKTSNIFPKG